MVEKAQVNTAKVSLCLCVTTVEKVQKYMENNATHVNVNVLNHPSFCFQAARLLKSS